MPQLITAGPLKPIYLEEYDDRLEELDVDAEVLLSLDLAILSISAVTTKDSEVSVAILDPEGEVLITTSVLSGQRLKVTTEDPELCLQPREVEGSEELVQPKVFLPFSESTTSQYTVKVQTGFQGTLSCHA